MTDAVAPAYQGFGTKSYRAYVLGALLIVYTFNFIDRVVIGIIGEPIKIEFGLSYHTKPANQSVTLLAGQTVVTSGTYVGLGSLRVTLSPATAVTAGAAWRRVGTSTWQASGVTESNIPAGTYQVEFKTVTGWKAPDRATVTIGVGQTASLSRVYANPKNAVDGKYWIMY